MLVEVSVPAVDGDRRVGPGTCAPTASTAPRSTSASSGAGDVAAAGAVERLRLDVSGAGDADLAELEASDVQVTVSGAGDATCAPTDRLEADVSGVGDLGYRGDPAVTRAGERLGRRRARAGCAVTTATRAMPGSR